jgi:hypothetical protein
VQFVKMGMERFSCGIRIMPAKRLEHTLVLHQRYLADRRIAHGDMANAIDRRPHRLDQLLNFGQACGPANDSVKLVIVQNRSHRIPTLDSAAMTLVNVTQALQRHCQLIETGS